MLIIDFQSSMLLFKLLILDIQLLVGYLHLLHLLHELDIVLLLAIKLIDQVLLFEFLLFHLVLILEQYRLYFFEFLFTLLEVSCFLEIVRIQSAHLFQVLLQLSLIGCNLCLELLDHLHLSAGLLLQLIVFVTQLYQLLLLPSLVHQLTAELADFLLLR